MLFLFSICFQQRDFPCSVVYTVFLCLKYCYVYFAVIY